MKVIRGQRTILRNAVLTGFFGGVIFITIQLIFHYFKISDIDHHILLKPFFITGTWLNRWYGYLFFILFISILSILIAVTYYVFCKAVKGWWLGALYGIFLWGVFYLFVPLIFYDYNAITLFSSYTSVSTFCILLIYGIFIGYSIAYDYEITIANNSSN